jgi:hypothetical protein
MAYWRSITFWLLLIVGWLISSMFLSVLALLFASFDHMTRTELWITHFAIHLLAVLAGLSFARSRTRRNEAPGFPVDAKSDGGPDAG